MSSLTPKENGKYVAQIYSNIQSNLIQITEDKLENTIMKFLVSFVKANSWLTPFSLMVAFLFPMLTSDVNKDLFGISIDIWNAVFYLLLIASIVWLIVGIINYFRYREDSKLSTLICKIKNI